VLSRLEAPGTAVTYSFPASMRSGFSIPGGGGAPMPIRPFSVRKKAVTPGGM